MLEPEVSSFQTPDLGRYVFYCLLCMEGKYLLGWLWEQGSLFAYINTLGHSK